MITLTENDTKVSLIVTKLWTKMSVLWYPEVDNRLAQDVVGVVEDQTMLITRINVIMVANIKGQINDHSD